MWTLCVLCLSVVVAVSSQAQGRHDNDDDQREDPDARSGMTPTESLPECVQDAFTFLASERCHVDCLQMTAAFCLQCDRTCNSSSGERSCPDVRQCTLGCSLARNDDGCRICECQDDEDQPIIGAIVNLCAFNATGFVTRRRCRQSCVRRTEYGCFACDGQCNDNERDSDDNNRCDDDGDGCGEGRICVLEGIVNRCIEMPSIGEECERDQLDGILGANEEEEDEDDFINELADTVISRIRGALDRVRSFSLLVSAEVDVPCSDPTSRCSSAGTCEEVIGPCTDAGRNGTAQCSDDGSFEALQCHRMDDGTGTCRCVFPRNGTMVPGSMVTGITEREEIPDCESRVFQVCHYLRDGQNYIVRHGELFVDRDSCTRCRCIDGNVTSCQTVHRFTCIVLNPGINPRSCSRGDLTIEHGTRMMVGRCNMCGCNNGRLTCTDIDGCRDKNDEQDEDERKCERCQDASMSLVCGRDGRTYNSRCIAMNCSGLGENDILDGPCSNQPICSLFPCKDGLSCIPLGGRSCLGNGGCTPNERRLCVNRTALRCRVANNIRGTVIAIAENDTVVCGSDRQTYQSFCHMIQQAPPNTRVVHAGRCDREECNSGQVCGTDGVTYNSTCHLRALSANAQVDYAGQCVTGNGSSSRLRDICELVRRREGKCKETKGTCKHRVLPRDGCCPVCGGITILAIDQDALDEYSQATGSDTNLDEFMARMTRDVIPDKVRKRCSVEVSHVRNTTQTNVEVKMIAKNGQTDSEFCHNSSKTFARTINNASGSTNNTDTTIFTVTLPVEASFASAAATAPLIVESDTSQPGNNNGATYIIASYVYMGICLLGAAFITV